MRYLYTLLFVVISLQLYAQRNFKPGYIVTLNGDTTKGFIDYKEWNENPRSITFKTTLQASNQQYSPGSIKAFGVDMLDQYQRYFGPITRGAVDLADLSNGIDSSFVTDSVFLRVITGGKNITLYSYSDLIKTRYFIAERISAPVELKRFVYLDNRQSDRVREFNYYIQQLMALAIKYQPGNVELAERIQALAYREPDIEKIVLRIDGTDDLHKNAIAKRRGMSFFAGLSGNFFKTTVQDNDVFLGRAVPSQTVLPGVNFGLDFYFNKNVGKWIFRTEVGLSANRTNFSTSVKEVDYATSYQRDDQLKFNQFTVSFAPKLLYNIYNTHNFKTYVSAGAQINFTKYIGYSHDIQEYVIGNLEGDHHYRTSPLRSVYANAIFNAGIILNNRFDIYAGYSTPARVGNYTGRAYSFNINSYCLGINYLFVKK